jgi:hypothetical protein
MDPVPDPLLLRISGSAGNRTRVLWICSQELWSLDHRGIKHNKYNLAQSLLEKSEFVQHAYEEDHEICWNEAKVLQIEPDATYTKYK